MTSRSKLFHSFYLNVVARSKSTSATDYCVDLVRKHDNENFLCTLLAPKAVRNAAFAIRAFNIEVALIGDKTREKHIALGRMKFWETAIENIYKGDVVSHPVALELARAVSEHKLKKKQLKRLLNARLTLLSSSSTFANVEEMEKYAEETVSPIYYLVLEAAGIRDVNADHAASHLGKAQGLANLIRSVEHHGAHNTIMLPQDLLAKYDIPHEHIIRKKFSKGLNNLIYEVASSSKLHLDKARSLQNNIPKDAKTLFLPAVPLAIYLEKLRDADFDIFDIFIKERSLFLGISLFWKKMIMSY